MIITSDFVQSPLNYTGGKFKLLPQIIPFFPGRIDTFVDLFCGGGNVGVNIPCRHLILNDLDQNLSRLFHTLKEQDKAATFECIFRIIERYGLSDTDKNGYEFYHCDSSKGLAGYNKAPYLELRHDFNEKQYSGASRDLALYTLMVYSFNNQLRFNSRGEFNLPVGKRDFNASMQKKLSDFIDKLQSASCSFTSLDFRAFDCSALGQNDFVYMDPPYLITCATYNEKGGWSERHERELLHFIDRLDQNGIRFALSNVLRSKGRENAVLIDWLDRNAGRCQVKHLNYHYSNSNYQTKDRTKNSEEVLIVNY